LQARVQAACWTSAVPLLLHYSFGGKCQDIKTFKCTCVDYLLFQNVEYLSYFGRYTREINRKIITWINTRDNYPLQFDYHFHERVTLIIEELLIKLLKTEPD
jgi:hypothetical protein